MSSPPRSLRVAIAGFELESVSYLPISTTRADFERVALRGDAVLEALRGTNTTMGGFIRVLEHEGIEIEPILHSSAGAAGPATDEAIEHFTQEILDGVAAHAHQVDGVLLFLHGACWSPKHHDPEHHVIKGVRQGLGADKPLMVAFDYHGNLDARTLEAANGAFAYRLSPHTDAGETGERAARCMVRTLRGEIKPQIHIAKPGVLVPSIFSATNLHPLSNIIEEAAQRQAPFGLDMDISVMAGFSYTDAHNTGFSVLATADQRLASQAQTQINALATRIWGERHALYRPQPVFTVDEALDHLENMGRGHGMPWVLLEHADRVNDSTYVLQALLDRGIRQAAVPLLWDPEAAEAAAQAGEGQRLELLLGAHSSSGAGPRLRVSAKVQRVGPVHYRNTGSYMQGLPVDLGLCALLDINGISVSVTSRSHTAVNADPFYVYGLQPQDFDIIVLRSKTHFRAFYQGIARDILIVDTPDHGPADLRHIPYRHLDTTQVYPFVNERQR